MFFALCSHLVNRRGATRIKTKYIYGDYRTLKTGRQPIAGRVYYCSQMCDYKMTTVDYRDKFCTLGIMW